MASSPSTLLVAVFLLSLIHHLSSADQSQSQIGSIPRRSLLGFKESPGGSNTTFECTPSGPCIPCQYSEKTEEKYRCSETGYRIPLKCVQFQKETKEVKNKKQASNSVKDRALEENKANKQAPAEGYVTYRSCIPAVNEEKLSVLGFEVMIMGLLLISGSVILLRRRKTAAMPGAGAGGIRMQTNPRF